jgi:hypothetical protein
VEDILQHQQYKCHVFLNKPGWENRLMNVIALAGTLCYWVLKSCSEDGWFADQDFYTEEFHTYYDSLKLRMSSFVGMEKLMFDELLLYIRRIFM